jgi:hypothetical protein
MPKGHGYNYNTPYEKSGGGSPSGAAEKSPTKGDPRYTTMEVAKYTLMDNGRAETRWPGKKMSGGMGGGKY